MESELSSLWRQALSVTCFFSCFSVNWWGIITILIQKKEGNCQKNLEQAHCLKEKNLFIFHRKNLKDYVEHNECFCSVPVNFIADRLRIRTDEHWIKITNNEKSELRIIWSDTVKKMNRTDAKVHPRNFVALYDYDFMLIAIK